MINPNNRFKKIWDIYIIQVTIFVAIELPARFALDYEVSHWLKIVDYIITFSFIVDMVFSFFTALQVKTNLETSKKVIARKYLKSWFVPDLLAAMPIEIILHGLIELPENAFHALRLLRLIRLLRVAKLTQYFKSWKSVSSINPSILRLALFLFWILMSAHWLAACWLAIGGIADKLVHYDKYIKALYWSITTLTTVGYGDITPSTSSQMIFTMIAMMLGAGLYGFIVGNIANLLANIDVARAHFVEKLEKINAFMNYRKIPPELQQRVQAYYNHVWESRLGQDEGEIIKDLPPSIRQDISIFMNRDLLKKVPIFQGAGDDFFRELVMHLKALVFIPNDFIIQKGDPGDNMYFIGKGSVQVVSEDRKVIYATIGEGGFFGELSLLLGLPRTASIRASDYCDLYSLDSDALKTVLRKFPDFAKKLNEIAKQRKQELADSNTK